MKRHRDGSPTSPINPRAPIVPLGQRICLRRATSGANSPRIATRRLRRTAQACSSIGGLHLASASHVVVVTDQQGRFPPPVTRRSAHPAPAADFPAAAGRRLTSPPPTARSFSSSCRRSAVGRSASASLRARCCWSTARLRLLSEASFPRYGRRRRHPLRWSCQWRFSLGFLPPCDPHLTPAGSTRRPQLARGSRTGADGRVLENPATFALVRSRTASSTLLARHC